MEDKKAELTIPLIDGILQYLGSRPYGEVVNLVQAIHQQVLPQVQKPEDQPSVQ